MPRQQPDEDHPGGEQDERRARTRPRRSPQLRLAGSRRTPHCKLASSMIRPPRMGPKIGARSTGSPRTASARPTCCGPALCATSVNPIGTTMAPAHACSSALGCSRRRSLGGGRYRAILGRVDTRSVVPFSSPIRGAASQCYAATVPLTLVTTSAASSPSNVVRALDVDESRIAGAGGADLPASVRRRDGSAARAASRRSFASLIASSLEICR